MLSCAARNKCATARCKLRYQNGFWFSPSRSPCTIRRVQPILRQQRVSAFFFRKLTLRRFRAAFLCLYDRGFDEKEMVVPPYRNSDRVGHSKPDITGWWDLHRTVCVPILQVRTSVDVVDASDHLLRRRVRVLLGAAYFLHG